jgi:putative transposase
VCPILFDASLILLLPVAVCQAVALSGAYPGKPDQNAFIERFNRTYRTEVLNACVFESLDQVREISAEWLQSYNEERPHDALAGLPLATYRGQRQM